jgi:hypothetical protein
MDRESDFLKKAQKVTDVFDKMDRMFEEGKIAADKYAQNTVALKDTLSSLKADHIGLIRESIAEIDKALKNAPEDSKAEFSDRGGNHHTRRELLLKRNELESERDMIDLCEGEHYIQCVRSRLQTKKYESYWAKPKAEQETKLKEQVGDDTPPLWVWFFAGLLILLSSIVGLLAGSHTAAIVLPLFTLATIILGTTILHAATHVAGIDHPSMKRALRSLLLTAAMSALVVIVFAAAALLLIPSVTSGGWGAFAAAKLILPLVFIAILAVFLMLFLIPLLSISSVYYLSPWEALKVLIVYYLICFILRLLLNTVLTFLT